MNRHIKSFLTFTGGAVTGLIFGGVGVIAAELNSEKIRNALKKAFVDWFDEWLFPEKKRKVSYRTYNDNRKCKFISFTDAVYALYADAVRLRDQLEKIVNEYGVVSLCDYYDLTGLDDKNSFDAALYGWTKNDVCGARIKTRPVGDCDRGYYVALPMPQKLENLRKESL